MSKIDVVCVTYRHGPKLETFLNCMLSQTSHDFRVTVIHDGPDAEFDEVSRAYGSRYPELMRFVATHVRHDDFGHTLREIGIGMAEHEWLLLTNGDNYYCPVFVETMLGAASFGDVPVVMCDMVHSHENAGCRPQPAYSFFETRPERRSLDIGCFIAKTELAKRVGFRDKTHDGDATYFEDLFAASDVKQVRKIGQVLFVHN